ncbi:MAG: DUF1573 domain-containing protein [Flavobacteriales bacterium]|jgi:hypothetical protein|nr:DUF1573 domain-containing protein [Flavobacteriales bacterium]
MKTSNSWAKKIAILSVFAMVGGGIVYGSFKSEKSSEKVEKTIVSEKLEGVFSFEKETIDYGTIKQNSEGKRSFEFTNKGNQPILIANIKKSCGCTVTEKPTEPILPGEKGLIKVSYDTKRLGKFSKTITVISNASEPRKFLKIQGNIVK